jgi:chorismate synthase
MASNSFGLLFRLTSFGESHGAAIGGIIDGCPAGLRLDMSLVQAELDRRRPGQSAVTSQRNENDQVEFLSGLFDDQTTGTPIGFIVRNHDHRSADYDKLKDVFRPSHADFTYQQKYGIRDYRGGGRSSARETVARVVAGSVARQLLAEEGISLMAWVSAIGSVETSVETGFGMVEIESSVVRCPDKKASGKMIDIIQQTGAEGDTLGGVISCRIDGLMPGLGEPVFDKLHADLGKAMLGINAVKGFEYGSGFAGSRMKGSDHNDIFEQLDGKVSTRSNHSGGIQGGISNGQPVMFRVAFKPVATLMKEQNTISLQGEETIINPGGRHDVCVVPRAVPIVEAMAALVVADHLLRYRAYRK